MVVSAGRRFRTFTRRVSPSVTLISGPATAPLVAPGLHLAATHIELYRSGLESMIARVARLGGSRGFGQGTLITHERNAAATQCHRSYAGAYEP
jgi:hypothetical protein